MIISTEQAKGGRIKLFCDGEYAALFEGAFWYSFALFDGDDISKEELEELICESERRKALQSAMNALSMRPFSEKELSLKLRQKEFSGESIEFALERCKEMLLLDDEEYAMHLAESLSSRKGYSVDRIKNELRQKGIERDIIEKTVEALDIDSVMSIIELLETKFASRQKNEKEKAKVFSALMRLGYTPQDIKSAFRECESWDFETEGDWYDE